MQTTKSYTFDYFGKQVQVEDKDGSLTKILEINPTYNPLTCNLVFFDKKDFSNKHVSKQDSRYIDPSSVIFSGENPVPKETLEEWNKNLIYKEPVTSFFYNPSPTIGEKLDDFINNKIKELLNKHKINKEEIKEVDFWTDSFGEIVEKLIIIHVRAWHLEDSIFDAYDNDQKLAEIKKKLDITWKTKRPKLVQALNKIIDDAVVFNKKLSEDSIKLYNGFDKNQNSK